MAIGRPASTTSGRLALRIDERLKLRAAVWAMRHGMTLSEMVEQALTAYMTCERTSKPEPAPDRRRKGERPAPAPPVLPGMTEQPPP